MSTLKVYGWIGYRTAYDHNGHHQTREIVAARSAAEVARIVGVRDARALHNLSTTGNCQELAIALAQPGRVFWRGLNEWEGPWRGGEDWS